MNYLTEYVRFETEKYVKGYIRKKRTINALKRRLQALDGYGSALDGEKVQHSINTDGVVNLVAARISLQAKIANYEEHIKDYESAYLNLTEDERTAIDVWFNSDTAGQALYRFSEIGINKNKAYCLKSSALETIQKSIIG